MIKDPKETEWINTVIKDGTIADKLAAHTLLTLRSKDWSSLDRLIQMVDPKKCRRQCIAAMNQLKDLFLESFNLGKKDCKAETEDDKKKVRFYYTKFIDRLSMVASDQVVESRKIAIWTLSELLRKYSHNKEYVLEKLIDKLGDKVPKLATAAGNLVVKSVNREQPEVRARAIKCIQRFMMKPNQSNKARYYSVALLSRIKLFRDQPDMANNLIETYLQLYTTLFKENKTESKMMSSILVGIHRAYPYAKLKNDIFEQHLQTLYKLVHEVNFRMRVVAIALIKNIVTKRAQLLKCPIEDRFYNLVFGQLIEPDLQTTSRQEAFASLVLSVINEDPILERKEAFVKRMLQVSLNGNSELAKLLLTVVTKIKGFNTCLTIAARDDGIKSDDDEDDNDLSNDEDETVQAAWVHKKKRHENRSNLLARNPRAAKPQQLNELYFLRQHCDPSVAELARKISDGSSTDDGSNKT